jgi:hypothetical protein
VKRADGEVLGVVTKTMVLEKLVKQRVKPKDPVSSIVPHYSIRHVSKTISLNELGRILVRNKFVLVEGEFFVTTSDLLKAISQRTQFDAALSVVQPQNGAKNSDDGKKDSGKKTDDGEDEAGASSTLARRAGLAAITGLAAAGAFFLMKKDK